MTNKKLRIAIICDNKDQFNSYIKTHKSNTQREYIYVDNNTLPHGIDLDGFVDLRELTQIIRTRLKSSWLIKNTWYGGFNDQSTDTENS